MVLRRCGLMKERLFIKMWVNEKKLAFILIEQYTSRCYKRPLMERKPCVNSVIINLCFWFYYVFEFFIGKYNFNI